MPNNLPSVTLVPVYSEQDASVYELRGRAFHNNYYIVSSEGTRTLMSSPEVVGFDAYRAMVPATEAALNYLVTKGLGGDFSIITILRGGLNYPLEEACHNSGIRIGNMNFLSCERIIENKVITGLDIKYEKLHIQKDAQFMIGDIIASGDTLKLCLNHVIDRFKRKGGSMKRMVMMTIGGTKAIELLESRYEKIHAIWPEFEGIDCIFYEGVFTVYEDNGVTGVNTPDIDFGWQGGVIAPEFRSRVIGSPDALFEKCIIYDGGARRYEIPAHCEEVTEYWESLHAVADKSDFKAFAEEKIGYRYPIGYDSWLEVTGLPGTVASEQLYRQEQDFMDRTLRERSLGEICEKRLSEFGHNMARYMDNSN